MIPNAAALARYGAVKVTTAGPGEILVMLYDGMLRFLRDAREGIVQKDPAKAGKAVSRAHAILEYLLAGLNPAGDATLCDRLGSLYVFCMGEIVQANMQRDPGKIDVVLQLLTPLRDAWEIAAREVQRTPG